MTGGTSFAPNVERPHALDDLLRERGRVHVRRLQLTQRDAAVRLDREPQHHLAAQRRIVTQLAVVQAVQRGLVAVEDDLDLLVGAARERAVARAPTGGAVLARRAADRIRDAADVDSVERPSSTAAADVTAEGGGVDAAAAAGREAVIRARC